ncbi:hypothetical protein MKJ01_14585 [Chryseobacterium sp. SSA4.19]|uniref:hypothetical protein n=1 Tax=Chryseobacterium sp. SSA4.19 TaxID=2919915 RepID=UPI001F4E4D3C|nr:hypothetical protein [Chryseobacterium sp. SSA4.19]MCJ8154993.1 hypothetical protein [Chryseobacterium sp. SSA4.19]
MTKQIAIAVLTATDQTLVSDALPESAFTLNLDYTITVVTSTSSGILDRPAGLICKP